MSKTKQKPRVRIRKVFFNNSVIEVSSRIPRGLPFVATPYMEAIIEGCIAAAAAMYPVTIVAFVFMGNHFHMILVVHDPADVPRFLGYIKGELAQAINRLQGRTSRVQWKRSYFSAPILDPAKVVERIDYLYQNPIRANLVDTIKEYPGVSSYKALFKGGLTKKCKKISRDEITALPERPLGMNEQKRFAAELLSGPGVNYELKIEPWAWRRCFARQVDQTDSELYSEFLIRQSEAERHFARLRTTKVIGADALRRADPRQEYESEPSGTKMWCLSSDKEQRKSYIAYMKTQCEEARLAYQKWIGGDLKSIPPPGFFASGGMLFSYLVPFMMPFFC